MPYSRGHACKADIDLLDLCNQYSLKTDSSQKLCRLQFDFPNQTMAGTITLPHLGKPEIQFLGFRLSFGLIFGLIIPPKQQKELTEGWPTSMDENWMLVINAYNKFPTKPTTEKTLWGIKGSYLSVRRGQFWSFRTSHSIFTPLYPKEFWPRSRVARFWLLLMADEGSTHLKAVMAQPHNLEAKHKISFIHSTNAYRYHPIGQTHSWVLGIQQWTT